MLTFNFKALYLPLFILVFVTACSNTQNTPSQGHAKHTRMTEEDVLFSILRSEYLYWQGTPYRLGGTSKKGIDCSALVQNIYRNSFKIKLPRGTKKQAEMGYFIYKNKLKIADLVFFKTAWKTRHVGIYIGGNQFLHTSTRKGVIISSLDNVYWHAKYWQSRRVMD